MQPQRWRAELERAQWQERQRYEALRSSARGAAGDAPSAASRPAAAPARAAAPAGLSMRRWPRGRCRKRARRAGARAAATVAPAMSTAATGIDARSVPPYAHLPARADVPIARALAPRSPPAQLPFAWPEWPARSTRACLQGRRLSVVLRDAALDPSDALALRERLRAQCEACGLELAELLINGVPVEPAAPISDEPGPMNRDERSTPWQST